MSALVQDLRFAVRTLVKSAGFTAIAVLTLAVGIGATTAMFGTLNTVLVKPLPYAEPERLLLGRTTFGGRPNFTTSAPDFVDYRDQNDTLASFSCMAGFPMSATVTGSQEPERVETQWVSWDLFRTLGIDPVLGRHFVPDEEELGSPQVAMVSHEFWQRRMSSDVEAPGKVIIVDGTPYTVVGVMPREFHFVFDTEIWTPFRLGGPYAGGRQYHNWTPVGRLADGVTVEQAQQNFDAISARLQAEYPETNDDKAMLLTPLHETLVEGFRPGLLMLMAAVSLLLLIACGNVANLLLARGTARRTELAVRAALGAGRSRLVRQMLTESLVIAAIAGLLGVVLALWIERGVMAVLPLDVLAITELGISAPMLLFAVAASVVTSLLFGTVPALRTAPSNLGDDLKAGARGGERASSSRLRSGLVVVQVGLSVLLLVGAGLLIHSFARLTAVDPGFEPEDLLTAELQLPEQEYPAERRVQFFEQLVERIDGLPGVSDVGMISQLPIRDPGNNIYVHDARQPPDTPADADTAYIRIVLPGYFEAMGIPLLAGRDVRRDDTRDATPILVVNESFAETFFPDENPIGQQVVVNHEYTVEIVGVVGDVLIGGLAADRFPAMYGSYYRQPATTMRLAVRSAGEPLSLVPMLREAVGELDREIPLAEADTMEAVIADSYTITQSRATTGALTLFAGIALLLATVGLYGVLAYSVSQRNHEIGVRMALGARGGDVLGMVVRQGMALVAIGLVLGLGAAIAAARTIEEQLFGIGTTDPLTYAAVCAVFVAVAAAACLAPAWRATHVDPLVALQAE